MLIWTTSASGINNEKVSRLAMERMERGMGRHGMAAARLTGLVGMGPWHR